MATFALNANPNTRRPETVPTAKKIIAWGKRTGISIKLTEASVELLGNSDLTVLDSEIHNSIDVMISLGGDGTILSSARLVAGSNIPIWGVNTGTLGFLTETPLDELEQDLDSIAEGKYQIDERMTLETTLEGYDLPLALNDVVIDRGVISRIITIDLFANSKPIATYQADGLILATPTGSTAYSLSVGGPILAPTMNAIIASPISAFGFYGRPFVFADDTELEVRVHSQHGQSALTIDGQSAIELPEIAGFTVKKGNSVVRLIRFHDSSFYQVLRDKLHWGEPPLTDSE